VPWRQHQPVTKSTTTKHLVGYPSKTRVIQPCFNQIYKGVINRSYLLFGVRCRYQERAYALAVPF
jgi:hypothetical protein